MKDSGDYISREYVLKCMGDSYKNAGISAEDKAKMTRWLKNAPVMLFPAADVRPRWISVKDALPELHNAEYLDEATGELIRYKESEPILIWLEKGGFMDIGIYEKSDAVDDFCYQGVPASVTYWMPLPEPPKEAQDG